MGRGDEDPEGPGVRGKIYVRTVCPVFAVDTG